MTAELPPVEAYCPRCGNFTARMVGGILMCDRRQECGYEHTVTTAIPIIQSKDQE